MHIFIYIYITCIFKKSTSISIYPKLLDFARQCCEFGFSGPSSVWQTHVAVMGAYCHLADWADWADRCGRCRFFIRMIIG